MRASLDRDCARHILRAASQNPTLTIAFNLALSRLVEIEERIIRSVLRLGLKSSISHHFHWRVPDDEAQKGKDAAKRAMGAAIEAELSWMFDGEGEPAWPEFPNEEVQSGKHSRRNRERSERASVRLNHRIAAHWIGTLSSTLDCQRHPWLLTLVARYRHWSATANGAGLGRTDESSERLTEWNESFYALVAVCLPCMSAQDVEADVVQHLTSLSDSGFSESVNTFLYTTDYKFVFRDRSIGTLSPVDLRSTLSQRLRECSDWSRMKAHPSPSMPRNFTEPVSTFFFNEHHFGQPPKCYLTEKGIEMAEPFLPLLEQLAADCPSYYIAIILLNFALVSPRSSHLPLMLRAAQGWIDSYPDNASFWIDHHIGRRLCEFLRTVWENAPASLDRGGTYRPALELILANLVRYGVPDARQLEALLWVPRN